MTEASSILLGSLAGFTEIGPEFGNDDIGQIEDNGSGALYAPATWLDALNVDERSRFDEHELYQRIPAPSDEAGLYPMFMRLVD